MEVSMRACPPFGIAAYAERKELMLETYRFFYGMDGALASFGLAGVTARHELAPGVTETTYDNGVRVLVNRSNAGWEDVAPMSHAVREAPAMADAAAAR